jgi:hypothetical protein
LVFDRRRGVDQRGFAAAAAIFFVAGVGMLGRSRTGVNAVEGRHRRKRTVDPGAWRRSAREIHSGGYQSHFSAHPARRLSRLGLTPGISQDYQTTRLCPLTDRPLRG